MTIKEYKRQWYLKNKDRLSETYKKYRQTHKEKLKAQTSAWVIKNRDRSNAIKAAWASRNKELNTKLKRAYDKANPLRRKGSCAARRARRLRATPKWLTKEHKKQLKQIYLECPKGYEVDHIIPLKGKEVRGLHVPWNLQYLTIEQNRKKRNKI